MTTFVRRIPDSFDQVYRHASAQYMERELGAVDVLEAQRHESPSGFADPAGHATGQRKDMSYCFAPYDGLRGLGMSDVCEYDSVGETQIPASVIPTSLQPLNPKIAESFKGRLSEEPMWKRALPYAAAGSALLAFVFLMRRK